jgi:hypothetical protein
MSASNLEAELPAPIVRPKLVGELRAPGDAARAQVQASSLPISKFGPPIPAGSGINADRLTTHRGDASDLDICDTIQQRRHIDATLRTLAWTIVSSCSDG